MMPAKQSTQNTQATRRIDQGSHANNAINLSINQEAEPTQNTHVISIIHLRRFDHMDL